MTFGAPQILKYLDKNYIIKEKQFFNKYNQDYEWGYFISDSLPVIFGLDNELCLSAFRHWANDNGLSKDDIQLAWGVRRLKTSWIPEVVQNFQFSYPNDSIIELIRHIIESLNAELNLKINKYLICEIKTFEECLSFIKCIGYEPGSFTYNPVTFYPQRLFESINYEDIINERKINPHWQDYIRATESNNQTS